MTTNIPDIQASDQQGESKKTAAASRWKGPSEALLFRLILIASLLLIILAIFMVVIQFVVLGNKQIKASGRDVSVTIVLPGVPETTPGEAAQAGDQVPAEETAPEETAGTDAITTQLDPAQAAELKLKMAEQILLEADQARQDAQDSVNAVSMLLSFLEGAAVLAGGSLGAAAYFGFRNTKETREEFKEMRQEFKDIRSESATMIESSADLHQQTRDELGKLDHLKTALDAQRSELKSREEALQAQGDALQDKLNESTRLVEEGMKALHEEIEDISPIFNYLLQANHELRLRNYEEAYSAVKNVLALDEENSMALYFAGWLELQYIPDHLEAGVQHLEEALRIDRHWASAQAAYGVALRRRALWKSGIERETLLSKAESYLLEALLKEPGLLDLNQESLWGPVAGIRRDRGEIDKAIQAYENARKVTPGSSYPHGNLATLYLRKAKDEPQGNWHDKALAMFEKTAKLAVIECSLVPNDYFPIMDIAMSRMMLTQKDITNLDEANEKLEEALSIQPTPEMLAVSERGWRYLVDYCPDDWYELRGRLSTALERIGGALYAATKPAEQ